MAAKRPQQLQSGWRARSPALSTYAGAAPLPPLGAGAATCGAQRGSGADGRCVPGGALLPWRVAWWGGARAARAPAVDGRGAVVPSRRAARPTGSSSRSPSVCLPAAPHHLVVGSFVRRDRCLYGGHHGQKCRSQTRCAGAAIGLEADNQHGGKLLHECCALHFSTFTLQLALLYLWC